MYLDPVDSANSSLARAVKLNAHYSGARRTQKILWQLNRNNCAPNRLRSGAQGCLQTFVSSHTRNCGHLGGTEITRILQVIVPWNAGHPALAERKPKALHSCHN